MLERPAHIKLLVALMWTSVTLFAGSAFSQSGPTRPDSQRKEVAPAQGPRLSNHEVSASEPEPGRPENKVAAEESRPSDRKSEVDTLKAENAVVRELLRKMEEQQKALLEQIDRLQRRLDGVTVAVVERNGPSQVADAGEPLAIDANVPVPATNAENASAQQASVEKQEKEDRYQDGIIIWRNPEDARVPFLLKFNNNTQIRYLNTLDSEDTFTDHLGVVRDVHRRNDITVNRSMFILRRLYVRPEAAIQPHGLDLRRGRLDHRRREHRLAIQRRPYPHGRLHGRSRQPIPRQHVPIFSTDRQEHGGQLLPPGFTQGVWANGEPVKGLSYLAFVGNGLNTLNISANKIDTNLLLAGSVWWEPRGPYSEPGKSRQMYDDYFAYKNARIRIGSSFTRSREDRFSEIDQSSPDNTSIYNSDGVLAFSTGAFAPGVTVQEATYKMWAIDGGLKKNGFSVNGQYYLRWLGDFDADGPLPLASTFDHGFELSTGQFIVPKTLVLYARGSKVFGQFGSPHEYAGCIKWYLLPTERLWLTGELARVHKAPYSGAFTPYTAGMDGWVKMIQTVLAF